MLSVRGMDGLIILDMLPLSGQGEKMEEYVFGSNLKLIYKNTTSELTSICIALNAGAGVETEKYGVAHATEHMVYKGTKNRSEKEINEELSNIFGFNNAMTNYPYAIYYGTLLNEDFDKGVDLLSDIILNPSFKEQGFKEEMDVIKEELKEWDEELEQYCEDRLFFNCFEKRRIKYPIIGTKESLHNISLDDIKVFYDKYYFPGNTSIVITSSLEFPRVKDIICRYFGSWEAKEINTAGKNNLNIKQIKYENPKMETFNDKKEGIKTCRVEIVCPIDKLSLKEMKCLRIFNQYFGEGINSILYDTLRINNGLVYDVITSIAYENYIKLYKITFSTGTENVNKAILLIKDCVKNLSDFKERINEKQLNQLIKNFKLQRLFKEEKSIILAKELATYDCMFGDYNIYIDEIYNLSELTSEMVFEIGSKVLKNITIEIINNV
ncbi:insulinase [Clostridium sp. BL-8]|nr:insulinase [Clostridium sp. BL-8]